MGILSTLRVATYPPRAAVHLTTRLRMRSLTRYFLRRPRHLRRHPHVDALDAVRGAQAHRPRHQRHPAAAIARRLRDREPHFARRSVADEPHRIERLLRPAGAHDDAPSRKIARRA